MTTDDKPEQQNSTENTIECINNNDNISKLIHEMLHSCHIVDEYIIKLSGLLKVFWGEATPDGRKLDEVIWMRVMVEVLPTECLIPIFKESMLELEGKQRDSANRILWENVHNILVNDVSSSKDENDGKEEGKENEDGKTQETCNR